MNDTLRILFIVSMFSMTITFAALGFITIEYVRVLNNCTREIIDFTNPGVFCPVFCPLNVSDRVGYSIETGPINTVNFSGNITIPETLISEQ